MRVVLRGLRDLVWPPACFCCGRDGLDILCPACLRALPEAPVLRARPPLRTLRAGAAYAGETERIVQRFKYPGRGPVWDAAPEVTLCALLGRAAVGAEPPALVVPIPLHARRLRARGFNPAGRLARQLARERGLPFAATALERRRDTPSQTGLDARARRRNVAGAFAATKAVPASVWLVDDVVTTGSTLEAAARALAGAGARRIVALAAAATPPPDEGG